MDEIVLPLTLEWLQEISPAESAPRLLIYFDSTLKGDPQEVDLEPSLLDESRQVQVTLRGSYNGRKALPLYVKVLFYVTVTRQNDFGAPCSVDGGFGMLDLVDLMDPSRTDSLDVPLLLYTCNRFEKGRLRVSRRPGLISGRLQWASTQTTPIKARCRPFPLQEGNSVRDRRDLRLPSCYGSSWPLVGYHARDKSETTRHWPLNGPHGIGYS